MLLRSTAIGPGLYISSQSRPGPTSLFVSSSLITNRASRSARVTRVGDPGAVCDGSGPPGVPPMNVLGPQVEASSESPAGLTRVSECPAPSAEAGHGGASLYRNEMMISPLLLDSS